MKKFVIRSFLFSRGFGGGFRSQSPSNGTNLSLGSAGLGFLNANSRNANRIETKLSACYS